MGVSRTEGGRCGWMCLGQKEEGVIYSLDT